MADHILQVRYTTDAHNFTAFRDLDAGRVGAFGQELVARQLGQATFRVWETCDTSHFAADILAAAIRAEGTSDWADFPLPDGAYNDATRDFTQQDIVNYIPLPAQQAGTRSRSLFRTAPGMEVVTTIGNGPHRGAISVEGALFVVSGNALYEVSKDGTATSRGTIPGTGRVCMAYNQIVGGNQLVVGNDSSGYVYNTYTGAFAQITDEGFVGFKSCDFLNQYIVGVEPLGRYWYHSALADATSYNTLDRHEAETSPDGIEGIIASHNEVLVFGKRTIEPWINDPVANAEATAFQLERGSVVERGCINGHTIRRLDNSVFFIGDDRVPYRLNGYTPQPIGTPVLAAAWRDLDPSKVFAFTYEDKGHVIYYVTWGDGQTWGYDVVTQRWHRRESFAHTRWRLNTLVKQGNDWLGGDFQNGKLYRLNWGYVYEGCEIMPRRIRTGVLHADGNPVTVNALKLVASTGGAVSPSPGGGPAPTISGEMPDYKVGTVVDFQYTITPGGPDQVVTLTVNGTLPTGLTINGTGHVTGTVSAAGVYAFSLSVASQCTGGNTLPQTVSITRDWVMARQSSQTMYTAHDPINGPWTATTRNHSDTDVNVYRIVPGLTSMTLVSSVGTAAHYGTDFDPAGGLDTTIKTLGYTPIRSSRMGNVLCFPYSSGLGYTLSMDGGATYTNNATPASMAQNGGMARLDSGRWLLAFANGAAPCGVMYTDDAVPSGSATWTAVYFGSDTDGPTGTIACNGTAACVLLKNGHVYRSTNGSSWSLVYSSSYIDADRRAQVAIGDVMLMAIGQSGKYIRSTDAGLTWTDMALPAACTPEQFLYADGILMCVATAANYYSLDKGLSWATLNLPFTRAGGGTEGVGVAPIGQVA